MRTSCFVLVLGSLVGVAAAQQATNPETLLRDRYGLSEEELTQVRNRQPVAKLLATASRGEAAVLGAVRLEGDKKRLSDWIQNVQHFRGSAELGTARVIASPQDPQAFAEITLDAKDLGDFQKCRPGKCAMRLPLAVMDRAQKEVRWDAPDGSAQANTIVRQMLTGYVAAYQNGGNEGVAKYEGGSGYAGDIRALLAQAATLPAVAPELAQYLEKFPAATLERSNQLLYWSVSDAEGTRVMSLHHLVVFQRTPTETFIADKTIYASRFFDAGTLVVSMIDAPGGGFYAVAGSRVKSSFLGGTVGVVRRQVERTAVDLVKMYLGWLRESLAAGS